LLTAAAILGRVEADADVVAGESSRVSVER
jgi:hypothetical protein